MQYKAHLLLFIFILSLSCKKKELPHVYNQKKYKDNTALSVTKYAKSFTLVNRGGYREINVISAWPNSTKKYKYILVNKDQSIPEHHKNDIIVRTPINKVVVMSTTNIPILEHLNIEHTLVGFPNTKYISSKKTRTLIEKGLVKDLNNDVEINMELLLNLNPELVIGFSVNGKNSTLNKIEKMGIPVVLDGAWTEQTPLGRAEWVKFIAAFFNKDLEANILFNTIKNNYLNAKKTALNTKEKPTVLSGSLFKEVWNMPGGNSFVATYLKDANTNYVWQQNTSTGSLQLNFEDVLNKAENAALWIGAGAFKNKKEMLSLHEGYGYFKAFRDNNIYTFTKKIGDKGGILYYELGPLRPDLILKDIIKIAHPNVLPNYESYFFKRLN